MIPIFEVILAICIFQMFIGVIKNINIPTKIMSFACFINYVVVLLCAWGLKENKESYVDIAYIYILLGLLLNLAFTKLKRNYDD